jgi:hypothetical protein
MGDRNLQKNQSLLVATDACRQAGHEIAAMAHINEMGPIDVCVTCTEVWGRLDGLRDWQEHCPCCFSEAHPHGLADLGITAQTLSAHHQPGA